MSVQKIIDLKSEAKKVYDNTICKLEKMEFEYLEKCLKLGLFDEEWHIDIIESGCYGIGVGVDCDEFKIQISLTCNFDPNICGDTELFDFCVESIVRVADGEELGTDDKLSELIIKSVK